MTNCTRALLSALVQRGWLVRVVAAGRVGELERDLAAQHEQGLFDPTFFQGSLSFFNFDPSAALPGARSLLVVAVPAPPSVVTLAWRGERHALAVPPTYAGYIRVQREVEAVAAACLDPAGFRVVRARLLPLKLLAVRSGLAAYGRNNITYVPGLGSFHELVGLYTDLPMDEHDWQAPRMLARCAHCEACRRACPTGAIAADRFLLHAERCLTYHNEQPPQTPFPAWIDPAWHNSLIGCMTCQVACPENRPHRDQVGMEVSFSEEETALLLAGVPVDRLPAETAARWQQVDLTDGPELLPRNLEVLLGTGGQRA